MRFVETSIPGAYVIEIVEIRDARGFFARTWCEDELRAHGLAPHIAQESCSYSEKKGTLRGLHYQAPPHEEVKLVRCTSGSCFDVIVDLRRGSPAFARWFGIELSAENRKTLYVPRGCAHGFQTLVDQTEVFYQMSDPYAPECARGVRWNDPAFGIRWPDTNPILSDRDRSFPDFVA